MIRSPLDPDATDPIPWEVQLLPDALEHHAAIAHCLDGKRAAIFLDYDGTLTPIVADPRDARLDDAIRATIEDLARRCTVAIVSGRERTDVARMVGLDNLIYVGSHGFDIAGPDGLHKEHERAPELVPVLDRAEQRVRTDLADVAGALVERKRFAIAAHYRSVAPQDAARVERAVDAAVAEAPQLLRKTGGKMLFELRPNVDWDKGRAVGWLLAHLGLDRPDIVPLYIGDDETDEDAFAVMHRYGGLGILVSPDAQRTSADYRLDDPAAVGRFLRRLDDDLSGT